MANLSISILQIGSRASVLQVLSSSRVLCGRYATSGFKTPSKTLIKPISQGGWPAIGSVANSATDAKSHNHTALWSAEKLLSAGLIGLIPAALMYPSPPLDYALALSLVMHSHWGLEAIVVDYVRPTIFGTTIPKLSVGALYVLSIVAFGGLCYFNYSDVGLAQAIRMLWKL